MDHPKSDGLTRRDFVKGTLASGAAAVLGPQALWPVHARGARGANEAIRLGVIGTGRQGRNHLRHLRKHAGVRINAICDADRSLLAQAAKPFGNGSQKVATYNDLRRLLDDKDIDAVVVATPNHWHALASIWACQAGKDVYVEKPVSHNIWEGRQIVNAARKYKRIVQAGTQNRSDIGFRAALRYIWQGNLGKIHYVYGLCYRHRSPIGKVTHAQDPPGTLDYNLWTGPAPLKPLMRKNLHYHWHWIWDTGNGDMGNLGAHQVDDSRMAARHLTLPKRAMSLGGRFLWDDDGQTPNTQWAFFDYDKAPLIIELRNLPHQTGDTAMDQFRGTREGNIIQCEGGYFVGGRGGGWVYDNEGKRIRKFAGDGGGTHMQNWLDAVRSRRVEELNADILQGHISANLCHMANVSYRIGAETNPQQIKESLPAHKPAQEAFEKVCEHLRANDVKLDKNPLVMGPWLTLDGRTERFTGQHSERANELLVDTYRKPFVVPETV